MKLLWVGCLTITAALAWLMSACTATPIPLPLNDALPNTYYDGGVWSDSASADGPIMDLVGRPPPDAMPGSDGGIPLPDGWDDEAGVTEGGPGEGGITEGGPGEGGATEGGAAEGGIPDLATID